MSRNEKMEPNKVLTASFTVRSYEADVSRKATVQTICNYMQEAAWRHAARLGWAFADHRESRKTWVLLRLHVRIQRYPAWGDTVEVATWPSGKNRLYAFRDFEMRDSDNHLLATAASSWIIIDTIKRRPQRLPELLEESVPRNKTVDFHTALDREDPSAPGHIEAEREFHVRLSDLDVNDHVNNVNFIEWAIEAVPASWREAGELAELHLAFKAESRYGERVVSQFQGVRPCETALHRVFRPADGKTLMLAETLWKPRAEKP